MLTLTASQQSLLERLDDVDSVQYLHEDGLEVHDVVVSALLGAVVSITYPQSDLDLLVERGLIELITPGLLSWADQAYYVTCGSDRGLTQMSDLVCGSTGQLLTPS